MVKKRFSKFIFWTPRILSIIFIFFLALMSLDVFNLSLGFWQTMGAFLIHNIPVFFLTILLVISWKHEIVGAITFILAGLLYILMILKNILTLGFEWYLLSWAIQISGIAFFIGILFLIGWFRKK